MSLSIDYDDDGEWARRTRKRRFDRTFAVLAPLAIATLWAVLAWRSPFSTRHFAPLLTAMSTPVLLRHRIGRVAAFEARSLTALSTACAMVTALLLHSAEKLEGPSFWSASGGALVEALLVAVIGGVAGMAFLEGAPKSTRSFEGDQPAGPQGDL